MASASHHAEEHGSRWEGTSLASESYSVSSSHREQHNASNSYDGSRVASTSRYAQEQIPRWEDTIVASKSYSGSVDPEQHNASYTDEDVDQVPKVVEYESPTLEQLSTRGSGSYVCALGKNCKRGGLHSDGSIRVFTRNSEYK